MIIRHATEADAPLLAALRYDFRTGLSPAAESRDAFIERCAAWMAAQIVSGSWHAWVAEQDRGVVGQIWLHIIQKVPNPVGERDRHGYISNLFVLPAARGGTGTRLLEAALAHAAEARIDRLVLWPTMKSESLYRRYGFKREGDVMERVCS